MHPMLQVEPSDRGAYSTSWQPYRKSHEQKRPRCFGASVDGTHPYMIHEQYFSSCRAHSLTLVLRKVRTLNRRIDKIPARSSSLFKIEPGKPGARGPRTFLGSHPCRISLPSTIASHLASCHRFHEGHVWTLGSFAAQFINHAKVGRRIGPNRSESDCISAISVNLLSSKFVRLYIFIYNY